MRYLLAGCLFLGACSSTQIENMYVQTTVGKGCTVTRGSATQAQGQAGADANVLAQAGQGSGSGQLAEMMASIADCKNNP